MNGIFLAFEGIDGCGKTTQIKILSSKLEAIGKNVVVVREPGGTPVAEAIRSILLDHSYGEMNGWTETFLFCAARSHLVSQVIQPSLQKGAIVLADRYRLSTEIYQGIGRNLPLKDVQFVLDLATNSLQPDLTFILDVPIDVSIQRMKQKNPHFDRMETSGRPFYDAIAHGFKMITGPKYVHLDGTKPIEEISEEIWLKIQSCFQLEK